MQGNILQCSPVMLHLQLCLPSGDVIHLLAARAARSSVIKRDKGVTDSFISVFSQGIAKFKKGTAKTHSTQADQRFGFPRE